MTEQEAIEKVVKYKMTPQEVKAFGVALLWVDLVNKHFPGEVSDRMRHGDPRKSHLFKVAWKLLRETEKTLPAEEIPNYLKAQIDVLRAIQLADGSHPMIHSMTICGEKAWRRWKVWCRKRDELRRS